MPGLNVTLHLDLWQQCILTLHNLVYFAKWQWHHAQILGCLLEMFCICAEIIFGGCVESPSCGESKSCDVTWGNGCHFTGIRVACPTRGSGQCQNSNLTKSQFAPKLFSKLSIVKIFAGSIFKCVLTENVHMLIQMSLKFVPKGPTDNKSALAQMIAWRQTVDKRFPDPRWPRSLDHNDLTQWGRGKMASIFQTTFSNAFSWMKTKISIKISLKFVPKAPIDNMPSFVQRMAWHQSGDKPLFEPMMVILLMHICVTRPQWVKHD